MNLGLYFKTNIESINDVIKKHTSKFDRDVVLSNLYLHLSECKDLNDSNIQGYIVNFCAKLKHWNKNRNQSISEHKYRSESAVCIEKLEQSNFDIFDTDDFDRQLKKFLNQMDNYLEMNALKDFYSGQRLETIKDYESHFRVKKRTAFNIKSKIKENNEKLFNFIVQNQI